MGLPPHRRLIDRREVFHERTEERSHLSSMTRSSDIEDGGHY
jgi:hypothetical protein